QLGQAGLGRGLAAGEAQGVGQRRAVVAAELGDGREAPHAGQHGDDGEGQDGGERVDAAARVARVGDRGQRLEQGWSWHATASRADTRATRPDGIPKFPAHANLSPRTALVETRPSSPCTDGECRRPRALPSKESMQPLRRARPLTARELETAGCFASCARGLSWSGWRGSVADTTLALPARRATWPERRRPCHW